MEQVEQKAQEGRWNDLEIQMENFLTGDKCGTKMKERERTKTKRGRFRLALSGTARFAAPVVSCL